MALDIAVDCLSLRIANVFPVAGATAGVLRDYTKAGTIEPKKNLYDSSSEDKGILNLTKHMLCT